MLCVPYKHNYTIFDGNIIFFDILLTVHLSVFISLFNQLDAQNLFHNKFYLCLYMFRAHVLIIRRSKLHYAASGIITPVGVMIPEATRRYQKTLETCRGMK